MCLCNYFFKPGHIVVFLGLICGSRILYGQKMTGGISLSDEGCNMVYAGCMHGINGINRHDSYN